MSAFIDAIARLLAGVDFFSVGCRAGCDECGGSDEGHFSWQACESCGASLGGDRFPAHGFVKLKNGAEVLCHFDVCVDCLMFHAKGDEPEAPEVAEVPVPAGWAVAETSVPVGTILVRRAAINRPMVGYPVLIEAQDEQARQWFAGKGWPANGIACGTDYAEEALTLARAEGLEVRDGE